MAGLLDYIGTIVIAMVIHTITSETFDYAIKVKNGVATYNAAAGDATA